MKFNMLEDLLPMEGAVEGLKAFKPRRHRPCGLHRWRVGQGRCERKIYLPQQKRTVFILGKSVILDPHDLPRHRSHRSRALRRKALRFSQQASLREKISW